MQFSAFSICSIVDFLRIVKPEGGSPLFLHAFRRGCFFELQFVKFYVTLTLPPAGAAGAVSETQAADSLPVRSLFPGTRQSPGQGLLKVFSPGGFCRKGGCRMTLTETLTFLAVIISLLSLIFTVLFGAFDIAWKIAERQNKNGQKK